MSSPPEPPEPRRRRSTANQRTVLEVLREQENFRSAQDGEILYRLRTGAGHRHYLVCRRCGKAVGFTPAEIEEHTRRLIRQYHYTDVTHYVDLYGVCPQCRTTTPPATLNRS